MLVGHSQMTPVTKYSKAAEQSCSVECRALALIDVVRHVRVHEDCWAAMLTQSKMQLNYQQQVFASQQRRDGDMCVLYLRNV
jgi:hypothetical protein